MTKRLLLSPPTINSFKRHLPPWRKQNNDHREEP